jgi:hypothetical protein
MQRLRASQALGPHLRDVALRRRFPTPCGLGIRYRYTQQDEQTRHGSLGPVDADFTARPPAGVVKFGRDEVLHMVFAGIRNLAFTERFPYFSGLFRDRAPIFNNQCHLDGALVVLLWYLTP